VNPRTTGILFLVALALGAFIYLYEIRGERERLEAEAAAKQLFPEVEEAQVQAIELTTKDGQRARLERDDGGWRLRQPLDFPADDITLNGMASSLAQLASEQVVEEPQPPDVYGLGEAARVVRFETPAGEHVLRIGNATPVGANTYVATERDAPVYAVPTYRTSSFERALDELREKRVLRFDRAAIARVEARWPDGGVTLQKDAEQWRVVAPIEDRADETTVESLLSDLAFLRAQGFLDEPPPEARAALEDPAFAVTLETAAAPAAEGAEARPPLRFELVVGGGLVDGGRVARGASESLYRIEKERLDDFPRQLAAYRFKQLAHFVATDARRLELVFQPASGGEPVTIQGQQGEAGWSTAPEAMAAGTVSRLVAELSRLRAADILADAMGEAELAALGLRPPRVVARVLGEGGDEAPVLAEIHLGQVDPERGIVARAAGDERVYRLDHALAEHVPVSLEAFRNRFVSKEGEEEGEAEASAEEEDVPLDELPADEFPMEELPLEEYPEED
jgi:hypothetical protein